MDKCELHRCLCFWMRMCRWMGYFPVEGLDKSTTSELRYNSKGFYSLYHLTVLLIGTVTAVFNVHYLTSKTLSIHIIDIFIFYITGFSVMISTARISKKWPMFIKNVSEIEHHLREIRTSKNTSKYCNIISSCVMIVTLVNHILLVTFRIYQAIKCKAPANNLSDIFEKFFIMNSPYYFQILPFHHIIGVIFQITFIHIIFLRSLLDVLIVSCSIYLISYFHDLNKCINDRLAGMSNLSWEQLRSQYYRMVELVNQVNAILSVLVLQAFFIYVIFICLKLAGSLKNAKSPNCDADISEKIHQSPIYWAHYVHSFLFHFVRFMVTSLTAAHVNLVAKKPLMSLANIPSREFCLEVQRFRSLVVHSQVAISGTFFSLTRPMILQIVGSIVTYEVVILQYN